MDVAQEIVMLIVQGNFAAVEQRLADRIKPLLPGGMLQAMWQGLEQQAGAFRELGNTSTVQTPNGLVHVVTCVFEHASLDVNVRLNDAGEIIEPNRHACEEPWSSRPMPPMSRRRTRILSVSHEQEVQIGHGEWVLPGTLTFPRARAVCRCGAGAWVGTAGSRRDDPATNRSATWPGAGLRKASPCCATTSAPKSMPRLW